MERNKADTFGIDGNMWYLLWGENIQEGTAIFKRTLGEIRSAHQDICDRPLDTGNRYIDVLAAPPTTPEQYSEVFGAI